MRRFRILAVIVALLLVSIAGAVDDITFLHISDTHVPHALEQSRDTIAALPDGPMELAPGVVSGVPEFMIVAGDLNEFSGGEGWWEQYLGLLNEVTIPVYHQLGNHDNTWECGRPRLRRLHGAVFYSFERAGVRFIGWDTATPQDPRPSIATEGLSWLHDELAGAPVGQPIIFFCHHPLEGREFADAYDRQRLLDLLGQHNTILLLVGHGHSARAWQTAGIDTVMGGSTWGDRRGFGIVSIRDGVLRVAHRHLAPQPQTVLLLEKPISEQPPGLRALSVNPDDGAILRPADARVWTLRAQHQQPVVAARWLLDGETAGEMTGAEDVWRADLSGVALEAGAHTLRLSLTDADGRQAGRTVAFWVSDGATRIAWIHQLGGSCQSTPLVAGDRIIVGSNDGALTALAAATGQRLWRIDLPGEVRSSPVLHHDGRSLYVGCAGGEIVCVGIDGTERWRCDAGSPVYGSPALLVDRLICGTSSGDVLALDADSGEVLWRSEAPGYAIETAPAVGGGMAFVGSWDRYVYGLDLATGEMRWRQPSAGSDREGFVARYYSPADCAPALAGRRLFVADRAYRLTIFDAPTGERLGEEERCVAVAPAAHSTVYIRHTDGRLSRRASDGTVIWTAEVPTGAIAAAPAVCDDRVWICSNTGTLSEIDARTGEVVSQARATTGVYVFASPAADDRRVYVADNAGRVIAVERD